MTTSRRSILIFIALVALALAGIIFTVRQGSLGVSGVRRLEDTPAYKERKALEAEP